MKTKWIPLLCLLLVSAGALAQGTPPASKYRISEPVKHGNLSVFLIHGENQAEHPNVLTLQEAMDKKILVVRETSNVNELTVENTSSQNEVFIQSGDIVKGGKQDRVLGVDVIVPAKSGAMPIEAFCVESGRWQQREGESAAQFSSSNERIVSKDLKLAANQQRSQSEVWQKVSEVQTKLGKNVGSPVVSTTSETSLQLALENKQLSTSVDDYTKALTGLVDGQSDVIGYAFAINGKINSADVYASRELFAKLWPKLLKASATEAVAELDSTEPTANASTVDVGTLLDRAEAGKSQERDVTARVKLVTRETADETVFEAHDEAGKSAIHKSFVRKH